MGNLLIRDISLALKEEISVAANSNGRSISDEVKFRLRIDSQTSERETASQGKSSGAGLYDQIRAIFHGVFETDAEFEEFELEIEESRKNEFAKQKTQLLLLQEIGDLPQLR
jgi:plasmid stability protein